MNSTTSSTENTRCHYGTFTESFGIFIQFLLALIAFSCLIIKRFCEPIAQRRPWRVWFYDTSKQGVGATIIHFANIILSRGASDPCIWYVMNFLLDSTVGLIFIFITLRLLGCFATCCNCKDLQNGEYGDPPKFKRWLKQCILYSLVMVAEKGVIIAVMTIPVWATISNYIMSPIKNANLELVVVMFIIPLAVNALMFWVVDNILMKNLRLNSRSKTHKYTRLKMDSPKEADELVDPNMSESSSHHD